jgi:predicted dehydrogenase/kynurenine formamidase
MPRLRGLCIGAGYFSRFHLGAWRSIPEVEIVAVCDTDSERAKQRADEFEIGRTFTDAARALDELDLDFVDLITRPETHLPLVQQVAARRLPVICQKPLAPDFATACEIVATARQAGVPLMIHENFRFQPWYREIKRLLEDGTIGARLHGLHFRLRQGDGWGADAYLARQPYFREMPRLLVYETGVHFIDTFRFLAGEIEEVTAVLRRLNPVIQGEDSALLTFTFASGAVGVWDASRYNESTAADPRYTFGTLLVEADGGSLRLEDDGRLFVQPLGQPAREHEYPHTRRGFAGDCVYWTQRHFVEQLETGGSFETSGEQYLKTLEVQEAAYLSAAQHRPVRPAEIQQRPDAAASSETSGATVRLTKPSRIVDLTLPIQDGLPGVRITTARTIASGGWNATTLALYSHCGTHMDAPVHYQDGAATVDQQSLDVCCGLARVLNLTPVQPRELLTVDRFAPWADAIQPGDRLLLRTDWYRRFGTEAYRNELPRISAELARWLVQRRVVLVGVEPPSVADVNNVPEVTDVHQILLQAGIVIVEGLAHLDELREETVEFIALPLRIIGGDGSPVRAIAKERQ